MQIILPDSALGDEGGEGKATPWSQSTVAQTQGEHMVVPLHGAEQAFQTLQLDADRDSEKMG